MNEFAIAPALPEGATLAIWPLATVMAAASDGGDPGRPIYRSDGKWLHPLFDLLDLLEADVPSDPASAGDPNEPGDPTGAAVRARIRSAGELFLRDRVIGRGAAHLILRAGIRHAWADLVSDGALAVFHAAGGQLGGGERIPAIGCATESLLSGVDDPETAWELLRQRRAAARVADRPTPGMPASGR